MEVFFFGAFSPFERAGRGRRAHALPQGLLFSSRLIANGSTSSSGAPRWMVGSVIRFSNLCFAKAIASPGWDGTFRRSDSVDLHPIPAQVPQSPIAVDKSHLAVLGRNVGIIQLNIANWVAGRRSTQAYVWNGVSGRRQESKFQTLHSVSAGPFTDVFCWVGWQRMVKFR
jgi:hypothetical protein